MADNRDKVCHYTIKYAPKLTTCSFDNAGLTVHLPTLGIPQLSAFFQPVADALYAQYELSESGDKRDV